MKTVHEVSKITGVSVRTLHHYDAIGLLKPTTVTNAGYRLYDDTALARLQSILLFRELEFPLKDIKSILDNKGFDEKEALKQQIELLNLKREHIDRLIELARKMTEQGVKNMDFSAFDKSKIEEYANEAKKKWGETAAYQEYEQKNYSQSQSDSAANGLMNKFYEIGKLRHLSPASDEVQAKTEELRQFITDNYYNCTKEILATLGQMYIEDERFRQNIDASGGKGTAEFVSNAIKIYCCK